MIVCSRTIAIIQPTLSPANRLYFCSYMLGVVVVVAQLKPLVVNCICMVLVSPLHCCRLVALCRHIPTLVQYVYIRNLTVVNPEAAGNER